MATPLRNIRVDQELWESFKERAYAEGRDVSSLIRELMTDYLNK